MIATGNFTQGAAFLGSPPGPWGDDYSMVEIRLQFDGYDGLGGRVEGRDAAGAPLFALEIGQVAAAVPCFTATSLIATGQGPMPVSALRPGARVITRDSGLQELLWVGRRRFGWQALGLNPLLRPVRIAAGALGQGLPERDMLVSPNHRFLTCLPGGGDSGECLTMARDLVGLEGITPQAAAGVEYWQLLFAHHELVLADGAWSESFLPTETSLAALESDSRAALALALPGIAAEGVSGFASVRPFAEIGSAA
ncbi:Hint domain-containing protein [Rhodobacter capsulatus]|uniref:Hint domain-containing protein n=1 Tax=Rhodobacter capsulatus TaxID=1061 RepID=A0A1G7GX38_RHOCA|nr:Hint domain-containing protein [Rhodobacter capsulatus]WER11158.1 Hint domain-containing protein [Rhodobacter capsulatus]SDE92633.1 Hint domain-containing protein [Rhodobacter capsulatus]